MMNTDLVERNTFCLDYASETRRGDVNGLPIFT